MPGFTIPNYIQAVTTGVGDQAEPDSVDFQILGNPASGVVFDTTNYPDNGAVTPSVDNSVSIATYKVIIDGSYYHKDVTTSLTLDGGDANPRFDLVVVPKASPLAPTFRKGTPSSTNPYFPDIVPGDIVLAAIYRAGPGATGYVTTGNIIDKRLFVSSNRTWISGSEPTLVANSDGAKAANGDLWVTTASAATGKSNLWVKSNGVWENLAEYVPMGTSGTSNLVLRDASGNFSAGTITANLAGTATNVPWTGVTGRPTVGNVTVGVAATPTGGSAGDIYIQVV